MHSPRATLVGLIVSLVVLPAHARAQAAEMPPIRSSLFNGLAARAIGPATMSGRIAAIDAVPGERLTIWVGAAGGGVWKSDDGGTRFRSVFDDHTQSIGAIAVDPSSPDTVWVGTGEAWTRNSVSVGDGVYRTTNGGDTWENMGLKDSEHIARIVVDPQDGKTVYVCALGHLWSTGGQRGVFRTKDGGKTWENVLEVDDKTGCSDLSIDPQEPDILYAGMWQVRRWPWKFESGGPGSGLYRSKDGGDTWQELENGLPDGEKGRIAVAPAPSRPSVVYALVEAKKTALYRSDDLGEHWTEMNTSTNIQMRPFYFGLVVPDPVDFDRVYKPGLTLSVSRDGGKSFTSPFTAVNGGAVHSDLHALWINPKDPQQLVLGTDGGVYISDDRGGRWRMVRSLPVGQFYQVGVDMAYPYNVYGGLQDNGSWMGPSAATGGVQNRDWDNIGFGDGFHAYPDPADSDYVYSEYQGGNLLRYQRSTGEIKQIRPYADAGQPKLRFNWNTPLFVSRAHPGILYYGAQVLFRSRDHGESWQRISPDLTTNDPAKQKQAESGGLTIDNSSAENYTTIYAISESPLSDSVIWVGTDDGNVQVTRNGGGSWTNVVHNVPGVPAGTWVSHVEASPHDVATAFVTFDGHRMGDMATYAYRTTDFGKTWQRLATDSVEGYAHVIRQDPVNPNLLFLGTEWGLWLSLDGGASWARYDAGLPARVAVRDLAFQPRAQDLVIATHGRALYILDDLTPIRHLTPEVLASDVAILPSRPAVMTLSGQAQEFNGDDEFVGRNPDDAASIVYYQKKRHLFGDLFVQVYDSAGKAVSNPIPGTKQAGINRVEWPMRMRAPKMPPATALIPTFVGPRVPEGRYRFTLTKGKTTYDGTVRLVPDPRNTYTAAERALQQSTAMQAYDMLERLSYVVDATIDLRDRARARADSVGGRTARRLNAYADQLDAFRKGLVATSEAGMLSGEEKLREQIGEVYGAVTGYDGPPTLSQIARIKALDGQLVAAEQQFAQLADGRLGLAPMTKEAWRAKT